MTSHPQKKAIQVWCTQTPNPATGDSTGRHIPLLLKTPGKPSRTSEGVHQGALLTRRTRGNAILPHEPEGPHPNPETLGGNGKRDPTTKRGPTWNIQFVPTVWGLPPPQLEAQATRPGERLPHPQVAPVGTSGSSRLNDPVKSLKIKPLNHSPQK